MMCAKFNIFKLKNTFSDIKFINTDEKKNINI